VNGEPVAPTVLTASLDFFVNPLPPWAGPGGKRLSDDHYRVWPEADVRRFLGERCRLDPSAPPPGAVVADHEGPFHVWRDLIRRGALETPFDLVQVDAHTNLGTHDTGWFYALGTLLHLPRERRAEALDLGRVTPENYVLMAAACGWLASITLVTHPQWEPDALDILFREADPATGELELRAYDRNLLHMAFEMEGMEPPAPASADPPIPVWTVDGRDYAEERPFDLAVFTRAVSHTPAEADGLRRLPGDYVRA
jgi:hypothetical protein